MHPFLKFPSESARSSARRRTRDVHERGELVVLDHGWAGVVLVVRAHAKCLLHVLSASQSSQPGTLWPAAYRAAHELFHRLLRLQNGAVADAAALKRAVWDA